MAFSQKQFDELGAAGALSGSDLLALWQGASPVKKATLTALAAFVLASDSEIAALAGASANGVSLVTAADYAAMRALLDLEAGTDFYSKSAADAAFQPLDSDLTAIAALTTTSYGRALLALADATALRDNISGWQVLAASGVLNEINNPGDTTEHTLVTVTVPAGAMGANGMVRISSQWSMTNSANAHTPRIKFGGTLIGGNSLTSIVSYRDQRQIFNRNATNSQVCWSTTMGAGGGWGTTSGAVTTAAIDTTAAVSITFTAQLATSTERLGLEAYSVEVFHQA